MKLMNVSLAMIGLVSAFNANAYPLMYPSGTSQTRGMIKLPKNIELVEDSVNPNKFYVLPPSNSHATITGTHLTARVGLCQSVAELTEANNLRAKDIKELAKKSSYYFQKIETARKDYEAARIEAEKHAATSNVATTIAAYDFEIQNLNENLEKLNKQLSECRWRCGTIKSQIFEAQDQISKKYADKQAFIEKNREEAQIYERLKGVAEVKKEIWMYAKQEQKELQDLMNSLSKDIMDATNELAKNSAGYASVVYESKWDDLMNELRELNKPKYPGDRVFQFEKIQTKNVIVNATMPDGVQQNNEKSWYVLHYNVNGQSSDSGVKLSSFPSTLQADMEISLLAACPIAMPELFPTRNKDLINKFGLTIGYGFDAAYKNTIVFEVNLKEFYQKVMSAGESGFLWWKEKWEKLDIDKIDSKSISFKWELMDPNNRYDIVARRRMEADAVNFIIADLLSKYGTPQDVVDPKLPPQPTSGLSTVGEGLMSLCGTQNIYCATASWVMKSLDAIIGAGTSSASGRRNFQVTETITWDELLLEEARGVTTFTSKKED